jgi:hypothetical protein
MGLKVPPRNGSAWWNEGTETPWAIDYFDSSNGNQGGYDYGRKRQVDNADQKSQTSQGAVVEVNGTKYRRDTTYTRKLAEYKYTLGTAKWSEGPISYTGRGLNTNFNSANDLYGSYRLPGIGPGTDEHNRAVVECLLKLGGEKPQLGQFIAESKQSAEMLAGAGSDLLQLLLHVKRGNIGAIPRDFGTITKTASDLWLQWQYGWKPLCSDLYGMHQDLVNKAPIKPVIRAKRKVVTVDNIDVRDDNHIYRGKRTATHICELRATVSSRLAFDSAGYGLTNPLSLGWEIVPFSFVVDWFLPIGSTLQALTATSGLTFISGYSGVINSGTCRTVKNNNPVGHVTHNWYEYHRNAYGDFPRPMPYAKRHPLTPTKMGTILALLRQLL